MIDHIIISMYYLQLLNWCLYFSPCLNLTIFLASWTFADWRSNSISRKKQTKSFKWFFVEEMNYLRFFFFETPTVYLNRLLFLDLDEITLILSFSLINWWYLSYLPKDTLDVKDFKLSLIGFDWKHLFSLEWSTYSCCLESYCVGITHRFLTMYEFTFAKPV